MWRQHSYTTIVLWISALSLSLPFRQERLSVLALEDSESLNLGVRGKIHFIRGRPRTNAMLRVLGRRYDDDDDDDDNYRSNLDNLDTDDLSYDDYDDSKKRKKDNDKSKDNYKDGKGKNDNKDKKNDKKNNDDGVNDSGNFLTSIIFNGKNNGGKNNGKGKNNGGKNNGKGKNKGETPVPSPSPTMYEETTTTTSTESEEVDNYESTSSTVLVTFWEDPSSTVPSSTTDAMISTELWEETTETAALDSITTSTKATTTNAQPSSAPMSTSPSVSPTASPSTGPSTSPVSTMDELLFPC